MLERGVPFSVVSTVMGWSAATTAWMVHRYGHISQAAQREAMETLNAAAPGVGYRQDQTQSGKHAGRGGPEGAERIGS